MSLADGSRRDSPVLIEGETCWRRLRADRAAVLVDAAGYYGALRASLLEARHSIAIAGWDIDSRTPIRGDAPPDDGGPETLGPLLSWLVERTPGLRVRVLLWDYSVLYALEREPWPRLQLDWKTPRRVRVCLDNQLPFGASHHEKLVVIDDCLAYCGGIDLTIRRWDRPAHEPGDRDRVDPDGAPYAPFHDLQLVVDGEAARALAELLRSRWQRASGIGVRPVTAASVPWPAAVEPDFRDADTGILRTRPAYAGAAELRLVEAALLGAIASAERLVYIENQYLTVPGIAAALRERLRARPELEVVIVTPDTPQGWLEEQTMGQGRRRFLAALVSDDLAARIRVLFPWVAAGGKRVAVMVHAKLMIVDDRLLQLGSSNLNRRSMGVDRECDLMFEARDERQRRAVRRQLGRLLGHHLGVDPVSVEEACAGPALIPWLDRCDNAGRGLCPLADEATAAGLGAELMTELADPEQPIAPERFIGDLFGAVAGHPLRRHALRLLVLTGLTLAALAAWRYTPLAQWADPERLSGLLDGIAASAWSGPIVLACFVLGSLVVFPVTVLIAATAAALGPLPGFAWGLAGSLLAAALDFGIGRLLPQRLLERWFGRWIGGVGRRLQGGGIVSIMLIRNLPVAPFSVVNVLAGAARVRPADFLLGTTLGMAPGIAALTLLGDRLAGVWRDPGWLNIGLLAGAAGLWIGIAVGLQNLSNRLARRR